MDNTHVTGGTVIGEGAFISLMVGMTNDNDPTLPLEGPPAPGRPRGSGRGP
jgi:hypothetical protein